MSALAMVLTQGELARRRAAKRQRTRRFQAVGVGLTFVAIASPIVAVRLTGGSAGGSEKRHVSTTIIASADPSDKASTPAAATTAGAPSATAFKGAVVVLDPGHNGRNYTRPDIINRLVDAGTLRKACDTTGTATADGYAEAAYAWDVAQRLRRILARAGARVVLTRRSNDGVGPCITTRAAIGNRARAEVAISIHADGGPVGGRGFHVIYPPSIRGLTDDIAAASRRLALHTRAAYLHGTGVPYSAYAGRNGLSVRGDLGGLNLSDVPKVFVETGNMRNTADARLLRAPAFRERVAEALADGLRAYLAGER